MSTVYFVYTENATDGLKCYAPEELVNGSYFALVNTLAVRPFPEVQQVLEFFRTSSEPFRTTLSSFSTAGLSMELLRVVET